MSRTRIGETVYVSQALPASHTKAGFEALVWTEVDGVTVGPAFGTTHNKTPVPNLKTGETKNLKAAASGRESTISVEAVAGDAGQAILKAAALASGQGGDLSIKIVQGSGVDKAPVAGDPVVYAQGFALNFEEMERTDSSYEGFTAAYQQNGSHIDDEEPA